MYIYQIPDTDFEEECLDEYFQSHDFRYTLKSDNKLESTSRIKLQNYNNRLALYDHEFEEGESGTIRFDWENINHDQLTIEMNYSVTNDISNAIKTDELLQFLTKVIRDFQELEEYDRITNQLYLFFRPHLSGLKNDLERLENPWRASYKKTDSGLKIFGTDQTAILETARNHPHFEETGEMCLPVTINRKKKVNLVKNLIEEDWNTKDNSLSNISDHGLITYRIPYFVQRHIKNLLNSKKNALYKLKDDINYIGRENIISLVNEDSLIFEDSFTSDLNQQKNDISDLKSILSYLDQSQLEVLNKIPHRQMNMVFGAAGTGKTEIAALLAVLYAFNGKNVWITSETNPSVDNLLQRINQVLVKFNLTKDHLNIIRVRNRNPKYVITELKSFDETERIKRLKNQILSSCGQKTDIPVLDTAKNEFLKTIDRHGVLEQLVIFSGDILLSTYGTLVERSYLREPLTNFDLNIVESATGINFATFTLSGKVSKQWVFIGDIDQLSPVTEGMYLPKSTLRFPVENELKEAKPFNFQDLRYRKIRGGKYGYRYKMSFNRFLNELGEYVETHLNNDFEKVCKSFKLFNQYRIHPDLYNQLCDAFQLPYEDENTKKPINKIFLDFSQISMFRQGHQRLTYITAHQNSNILEKKLVETFIQIRKEINDANILKSNLPVTIGITGMNTQSVRIIIRLLQTELTSDSNVQLIDNLWIWRNDLIELKVGSIKFHQESEYDIFMIVTRITYETHFRERLYTALTRAESYVFIFGPKIKKSYRQRLIYNKDLLYRLQQ